jgi:POT family proton-dependent oligopeptide transporter
MFKNHPKGLYVLFFTEMWERFGFYTMLSIFVLYLGENFHWSDTTTGNVYGLFLGGVYFTPLIGGWLADNIFGYSKTIIMGALTLAIGYALMAVPTKETSFLYLALVVVVIGNGLFKANISVLVGNLYSHANGSLKDAAYNIFYMGINVGAFFAPFGADAIKNFMMKNFHATLAEGYNAAFGLAAIGMLLSIVVFTVFRKHYKEADYKSKDKGNEHRDIVLTKQQEKDRIVALITIFAIVIFFWMIYYQNGFTLTLFAKNYTVSSVGKWTYLLFDPIGLFAIIAIILGLAGIINKKTSSKLKTWSGIVVVVALAIEIYKMNTLPSSNPIAPELFQTFNPMFIVFLTPIIVGIFAWLNKKKKEPSTPGKMGLAMVITAFAYLIMIFAAYGLPKIEANTVQSFGHVTPYWLISTYFVMTIAELFLSPMGLSFVSKVAPPRMKGLMMGGWFVASAIGSYLSGFIGRFYQEWQLWEFFLFLLITSLISAGLVLLFLKRLRRATE